MSTETLEQMPSIRYFQNAYKRYTNFGKQLTAVPFDSEVRFGGTSSVILPKSGDFLHRMYLRVTLPNVVLLRPLDAATLQAALNQLTAAQANIATLQQYNGIVLNACSIVRDELALLSVDLASLNNAVNHYFIGVIDNNLYLSLQTAIAALNPDILQNSDIKAFVNATTADPSITSTQKTQALSAKVDSIERYLRSVLQYYHSEVRTQLALYEALNDEHYRFAWIPFIGHFLAESIELSVGDQRIDLHSDDWVHLHSQLHVSPSVREVYDSLIGNTPLLTSFDRNTKPQTTIVLPLQFSCCRFNGSMLPLVALQYQDVALEVRWAPLAASCETDAPDISSLELVSADLLVEYFYADKLERTRFAQLPHEYLIEQVQYNRFDGISSASFDASLDFNHCSKQIFWFLRLDTNTLARHDFSFQGGQTLRSAFLQLESHRRMDPQPPEYYNYTQPYEMDLQTPDPGLYSYSFGLQPSQFQPAGCLNFSKLRSAKLVIELSEALAEHLATSGSTVSLYVFSASYNFLRIFGGKAGLAHSF